MTLNRAEDTISIHPMRDEHVSFLGRGILKVGRKRKVIINKENNLLGMTLTVDELLKQGFRFVKGNVNSILEGEDAFPPRTKWTCLSKKLWEYGFFRVVHFNASYNTETGPISSDQEKEDDCGYEDCKLSELARQKETVDH